MFQDENDIKDLPKLESNFNEKLARKKAKKELKKEAQQQRVMLIEVWDGGYFKKDMIFLLLFMVLFVQLLIDYTE